MFGATSMVVGKGHKWGRNSGPSSHNLEHLAVDHAPPPHPK